jgi:hypothetical protein
MNDERLRERYRAALSRRRAPDRAACPDPETLLAVVERRAPGPERIAVLDHAAACAACLPELELLRGLRRAAATEKEGAGEGRSGPEAGTPRWVLALAASLLVLAGGAALGRLALQERAGPEVMRGGAAQRVVAVSPADGATVTAPLPLVWRAAAGATGYTVEVLDTAGEEAHAAGTGDTVAVVPVGALRPGTEYLWRVRAWLPDGSERASGARRFRVGAGP